MSAERFTDEQRERALQALVLAGKKAALARELLLTEGIDASVRTLNDWKNKYADRIEQLDNDRAWFAKRSAADQEALHSATLTHARAMLAGMDPENPKPSAVKAYKDLVDAAGKLQGNARTQRDMPTTISEDRSLPQLLRAMSKFAHVLDDPSYIDSTATEVDPPSLPPTAQDIGTADESGSPADERGDMRPPKVGQNPEGSAPTEAENVAQEPGERASD